jgi:hypothetical protein
MKKIAECLCFFSLLGFLALPVEAATHKKPATSSSTNHATQHTAQKTSSSKTRKSAPAPKSSSSATAHAGTSHKSGAGPRTCRTVKNHKGKSQRVCSTAQSAAPEEPALRSPIRENALDDSAPASGRNGEIKARTVPDHAYAVDGETFFYQGKKYRIAGLSGTGGSDMDKQRLQKALDGGALNVDTVGTDDSGMSVANVTVNGQSLVDQLR